MASTPAGSKTNLSPPPRQANSTEKTAQDQNITTAKSGNLKRQASEKQSQPQEEIGEEGEKERVSFPKSSFDSLMVSDNPQTEGVHTSYYKACNSNTKEGKTKNPNHPPRENHNRGETQSTKDQEPNTIFRFEAGTSEAQNKRGYRTTDLSLNFWKALELNPPSVTGASRLVVLLMLIKK